MHNEDEIPMWETQNGGLVTKDENGELIFITKPNCSGLDVGDVMPDKWWIAPVNHLALITIL